MIDDFPVISKRCFANLGPYHTPWTENPYLTGSTLRDVIAGFDDCLVEFDQPIPAKKTDGTWDATGENWRFTGGHFPRTEVLKLWEGVFPKKIAAESFQVSFFSLSRSVEYAMVYTRFIHQQTPWPIEVP